MAKNTLELKKELSLSDYYKLSKQVASYYASTVPGKARTAITTRYDITESAFYTLLEFSITHHLVDDKTVQKIRTKILANQGVHGNKGYYSNRKYNELEKERKNYSAFSKKDIKEIATYFANNPDKSKLQVSRQFGFHSTVVLDQLLKKACVELIISDKVYKAIINRALRYSKDLEQTMQFFNQVTRCRLEAKTLKDEPPSAF